MRVQYTINDAVAKAIASRAKSLGLNVGRLVEHVMTQWLAKNEAVTLMPAPVMSTAGVDPNSPFKHGAPILPPEAFMTPSGKRRVDRVNFRMPICAECTMDVKEEEIGPGDMHIGCPGRT